MLPGRTKIIGTSTPRSSNSPGTRQASRAAGSSTTMPTQRGSNSLRQNCCTSLTLMALSDVFFNRIAVKVARDLIGVTLLFHGAGGVIVETEAYAADDEASHSFGGRPSSKAAMFGPPGP